MKEQKNPVIDSKGSKRWYQSDKLHRLDGPAIKHANGNKIWCQHGKIHRLNGPAIEWSSGNKHWFLGDVEYSEEEYWLRSIILQAQLKFKNIN